MRQNTGNDGEFTLYEDENDGYNYEKGIYATIEFEWDESDQTFTIEDRKGSFPGMLQERVFIVRIVDTGIANGVFDSHKEGGVERCKTIHYNGKKIVERM